LARSESRHPLGTAVVTGASSGIGRATSLLLARAGFRVFAGVRRDADAASIAGENVAGLEPLHLDVTDAASIAAARETVEKATGDAGLAGLVNNAGIGIAGPLEFLPLDELRRQLEVNVVAPMAVAQAFLPQLRRARGRLVHIGSSSGYLSMPLVGPYCASKFALEALADAQRLELQPWGLHVALVQPGAIATPIFDKSNAHADALMETLPPDTERLYGPIIAAIRRGVAEQVRRAKPPETVARAVLHALTSPRPRTRYVVGIDAWLEWLLARCLPDRLRDRALTRLLGLPAPGSRER
jgi:NAD(P)-dependent dehydrogenase (short-subunit alcohol dehydrogenase family)